MSYMQSTPQLCRSLLSQWRNQLELTKLEKAQMAGELKALDKQLERLSQKYLRITVFGRVGVGKSSLLNALLGKKLFPTDVAHGCTRKTKSVVWSHEIGNLTQVELVDTPGIDEIAAKGRARLASRIALNCDLVLFVLDSDVNVIELEAIENLLHSGKPLLLVLNRCDQWRSHEIKNVLKSIRHRLPPTAKDLIIEAVSAAPRKAQIQANGRIRSKECVPIIGSLQNTLIKLLKEQGNLLLALNALRQADNFYHSLKTGRLERRKTAAQTLIGKFATIKASGVAVNPLLIFDLATGFALDTALIIQLSKLYGLQLKGPSARKLIQHLSLHNSFLGGVQIGIHIFLGAIRHILILGAPFTGGLSLASTAPVALAQAALAVHTTKLTGRLAAKEFLRGSQSQQVQPSSILRWVIRKDPEVKNWLSNWPLMTKNELFAMKSLLP
ncbi:GTP-binding protein [Prochlorococcus marinus]|uniref:GTPase SAR1 and related small G protein n=1 Tax=Prochlorococcus marinus (strain MIT 9211) TaxID=93059 RepID=A9BCD2_PROM4|nr:GTP-binding protein [Prochlorococcus marinus]ABX09494.1 GTPase SAR1 and related small G protein [Prochlorococcus marinus str. MIT 9211]